MQQRRKPVVFISGIILMVILALFIGLYARSPFLYGFGFLTKNMMVSTTESQSATQLQLENEQLRDRLQNLIVDYAELKNLRQENSVLRNELDYLKESEHNFVIADIIAGSSLPTADVFIINKGSVHGIKPGQAVTFGNGIIVGKVQSVDQFTSTMTMVDHNNSLISAVIQNEQQTPGSVKGELNLALTMQFIPLDQEITPGLTVVTSGREKNIPYGLVIGQITSVEKQDNNFFQTATISSPIKLSNLRQVAILTQSHDGQ